MNIKCPKCGSSVIYDAASGMMKCTACQQEYNNSSFSELDGYQQSEGLQEQDFRLASDDDAKETRQAFRLASDDDTKENKHGFRLAFDDDAKETKQGLRLASDSDINNDDTRRWTDTLKRKEAKSFEDSSIGDEELKDEERIIQYIDLNIYKCTSCGAQLMLNDTEASTFCSFCGLPTIVFDRVSKEECPDKIIPFKLTKEQALLCIKDRIGYGKYIPNEIRELSVEDIRCIYMPYWLYTSYIRKSMTLHTTGNTRHAFHRDASCRYEYITADASLNLNNTMSQRLDPFYMNELEDFDAAYLSGFYANKYDVPPDAVQSQIKKKISLMLDTAICRSVAGNVTKSNISEEYHVEKIHYALLPAFFVTLRYGSDVHLILVNGQTGKVVSSLPANPAKIKRTMVINVIISCILYSLINTIIFSGHETGILLQFPLLVLFVIILTCRGAWKQYKKDIYNLNAKPMTSYVHDRD